jgi:hypothetical protein
MSRTVTFWKRGVAGLRLGSKRLDPRPRILEKEAAND